MQHILDQSLDMATALLAGEKLKELILPGSSQDEKSGALASLMVQLKLELPFDRVVTIGTVIIPILLVTLVFTRNFAGEQWNNRIFEPKQLKSLIYVKKKRARGKTVILQTELGSGKRKEKDTDWGDGSSVLRHTLQLQPSGSEQKHRKMFKTGI